MPQSGLISPGAQCRWPASVCCSCTCAGLWRYHIGDTIRFTSTSPHFIEFTGRDRFLDKLEEKVTQGEVEQAISALRYTATIPSDRAFLEAGQAAKVLFLTEMNF